MVKVKYINTGVTFPPPIMAIAEKFQEEMYLNSRSTAISMIIMQWSEWSEQKTPVPADVLVKMGPGRIPTGIVLPKPVMDIVESFQKDRAIDSRSAALSMIIWEWSKLKNNVSNTAPLPSDG